MPLLNEASNVYLGTQPVDAIYRGDVKVWPTKIDYSGLISAQAENIIRLGSDEKLYVGPAVLQSNVFAPPEAPAVVEVSEVIEADPMVYAEKEKRMPPPSVLADAAAAEGVSMQDIRDRVRARFPRIEG